MPITVDIITPSQVIFKDRVVTSLVVDTTQGEIEILPAHRPLLTLLDCGLARLHLPGQGEEAIAVSSGLLKLENDHAVLLVAEAVSVHMSDTEDSIETAKKIAYKALSEAHRAGEIDQEYFNQIEAKIRAQLLKKADKR